MANEQSMLLYGNGHNKHYNQYKLIASLKRRYKRTIIIVVPVVTVIALACNHVCKDNSIRRVLSLIITDTPPQGLASALRYGINILIYTYHNSMYHNNQI